MKEKQIKETLNTIRHLYFVLPPPPWILPLQAIEDGCRIVEVVALTTVMTVTVKRQP